MMDDTTKKAKPIKPPKTAVFKGGKKTAKTDSHKNNRRSVFGSSRPGNPLDALLAEEAAQGKSKR